MPDLPLLKAAFLCETVIERKDGVLSAINIVDTRTMTASGESPPAEMPPHTWGFCLLVMFTGGPYVGMAEVTISLQRPNGTRVPIQTQDYRFERGERGVNLIMQLNMTFENEGLYWFEISVNEVQMTRVPLRIVYSRVSRRLPPP